MSILLELFDRSTRPPQLNAHGQAVVVKGREVLRDFEALVETARAPGEIAGMLYRSELLEQMLQPVLSQMAFTVVANITGLPAMSVPLHWTAAGLPLGMQFTGRMCDEATLYSLAGQLERARPWFHRRPPL